MSAYELRRRGRRIRLERQPLDLLILLVERSGQLVTREEIAARLWSADVFVDVEAGINTAIRKIRRALGDSADVQRCLETVPGKGYRFIALETTRAPNAVEAPELRPVAAPEVAPEAGPSAADEGRPVTNGRLLRSVLTVGAVAGVLALLLVFMRAPDLAASQVIGVLPFENLTGDPGLDYLVDGLVDETIASLSHIDPVRLSVIGRTSMMSLKGTTRSLGDIGRTLAADYLVEGAVRVEGERYRTSATLVRTSDQVQVWSASFDREPTTLLGLQRDLSTAIAEQIRLRLTPERSEVLARRQTARPEAFDLYLRGRYAWNHLSPTTMPLALDYYRRATALDPTYALAWAGIADAHSTRPINSDVAPSAVAANARSAAERAVGLAEDLSEAQVSLGIVRYYFSWDWPGAEASFERAVELDPSNPVAHRMLGHVRSQMGRHADGLAAMSRARQLDPFSAANYALGSQVSFQARRYEEAMDLARQATVIDPTFWIGYMVLGQAYERLGRIDEALQALGQSARLSAGNSKPVSLEVYVLAQAGRIAEAATRLESLLAPPDGRFVPPYTVAIAHAGLGDREAMFEWLGRALAARDVHLVFLPVDPKWDPYRDDARFRDILDRAGLRFPAPTVAEPSTPS